MTVLGDLFRSLVGGSEKPKPQPDVLTPVDFPLKVDGKNLSTSDGGPIAVAKNGTIAAEIAERLNTDEQRNEEDKWSA